MAYYSPFMGDMITDNIRFAYVIDTSRHALIKIDFTTGERQVIHSFILNVEPNKYSARNLSLDKENNITLSVKPP